MPKLRALVLLSLLWAAPFAIAAPNFSICPNIGDNTAGCALLITLNADGTTSFDINPVNSKPYDGVEDSLIGVINNTASALAKLTLSSPTQPIFGFDGDGICAFQNLSYCSKAPTGYEGPNNTFSNIAANFRSGDVLFTLALAAAGGNTYFSLEESPASIVQGGGLGVGAVPEPETYALMAIGLGLLGWQARRRRR